MITMKKLREDRLTRLFDQVAEVVIDRAIETGTPVIVWEDDAIKSVDPRKIRLPARKQRVRAKKNKSTKT